MQSARYSLASQPTPAYQPVPILHLFPRALGDFEIYVRQGDTHTLFAKTGERFTARHRQRLREHGVEEVYIRREDKRLYKDYIRRHLPEALAGDELSRQEKAAVFYRNSCDIIRDLVGSKLPVGVTDKHYALFFAFVRQSVAYLSSEAGLRRMAGIIAHDYDIYSHSVHVFVYAAFLLKFLRLADATIVQSGIGALLHDAGKEAVGIEILGKPGPLTPREWQAIYRHPERGIELCRSLPLSPIAANTILMHHEKMNGKGYPSGLRGEDIPLYVRAISLADVYDALTSKRVYADALPPFEALKIMRYEMDGSFDPELYKRFILLLSGADVL